MPTSIDVTPALLRDWALPGGGSSKYDRGQVVVIGGAIRSPGAAILAGRAALRAGCGRLTLAVGASVAAQVGVALPESGVVPLSETSDGHIRGDSVLTLRSDLEAADAILIGPGLDDAEQVITMVRCLAPLTSHESVVIMDAFALGALAKHPELGEPFAGQLIVTPNSHEASLLLDSEARDDLYDAQAIAARFDAVVCYSSVVAAPGHDPWVVRAGNPGLGTSGSGDVLAGAITGLSARADAAQAAVWGTWAHSRAGDRLAERVAPLGYLASDLIDELPGLLRGD